MHGKALSAFMAIPASGGISLRSLFRSSIFSTQSSCCNFWPQSLPLTTPRTSYHPVSPCNCLCAGFRSGCESLRYDHDCQGLVTISTACVVCIITSSTTRHPKDVLIGTASIGVAMCCQQLAGRLLGRGCQETPALRR